MRSGGCCNGDGGACESCVVNAAVEAVGEVIYGGNYAAVVLLTDEVCYLLAFESCLECLDCVGVFVAFLDCEDVAVCRGGAFLEQGVLNGVEACVYCIVAVDDCVVNVGKKLGDRCGLGLNDLNIVRVLCDVVLGCGDACAVLELDDAGLLEQEQCAGFVGCVVGNCDLDDLVGGVVAAVAGAGACREAECEHYRECKCDYFGELFHFRFLLKSFEFNEPCRLSVINILCVPGTHSHDLPFHTAHLLSNRNRFG